MREAIASAQTAKIRGVAPWDIAALLSVVMPTWTHWTATIAAYGTNPTTNCFTPIPMAVLTHWLFLFLPRC